VNTETPSPETSIRLDDVIERRPVGTFHVLLLTLTGSVMFLDGLDTQSISFVAPVVAKQWHLSDAALGPMFSASIVGLLVGYLVLSPLADRIGHRTLIISATTLFAVFTLLCAFAGNEPQLLALRLLTGIGLGAAIPSTVALAGEFAPSRRRSTFVMLIYCWLALGFVAASLLSRVIIPLWGWRPMFLMGGVLPLILVLVLLAALPESPSHLLGHNADTSRVHACLRRLDPRLTPDTRVIPSEPHPAHRAAWTRTPFELVGRRRLPTTLLLWTTVMLNLGVFYAIQSWLPKILAELGYSASTAAAATAATTIGGIAAAALIGTMMDKRSAFGTLGIVYLAGAVFITVLGLSLSHTGGTALVAAAFLAGTCVTGGQMSVIALAATLHPPRIRPAGVGWALGIGRIGGILGPLLLGLALDSGTAPSTTFLIMSATFLLASTTVFALARTSRTLRASDTTPQTDHPATGQGGPQPERDPDGAGRRR
jgi:MFS transporter, AAHS family, 4-hydroxybenzoate transporter